jgi:hypothetical protein
LRKQTRSSSVSSNTLRRRHEPGSIPLAPRSPRSTLLVRARRRNSIPSKASEREPAAPKTGNYFALATGTSTVPGYGLARQQRGLFLPPVLAGNPLHNVLGSSTPTSKSNVFCCNRSRSRASLRTFRHGRHKCRVENVSPGVPSRMPGAPVTPTTVRSHPSPQGFHQHAPAQTALTYATP